MWHLSRSTVSDGYRRGRLWIGLSVLLTGLMIGCGSDATKSKSATKEEASRDVALVPGSEDAEAPRLPMSPAPMSGPNGKMSGREGQATGSGEFRGLERDEKRLKGKIDSLAASVANPTGKDADKKDKEKSTPPNVWKRDGSRPTFARVYVGDGNSLEMVSLHVNVIVEGPRVRTLVDHVFRNPHDRQLEGTFEYPLPAGASPSYYAMFLGATRDTPPPQRFKKQTTEPGKPALLPEMLAPAQLARAVDTADWGKLQEARIVGSQKASAAYEEIVRGRIDPALLEYASGNTFRGRVFPIPAKGYNRVILAYEETLPVIEEQLVYRYALPTCKLHELRLTLQGDIRECKSPQFVPKDAHKELTETHVIFTRTWSDTKPEGEVLFTAKPSNPGIQVTSGKHGEKGPIHVYARVRPELPKIAKEEPFAQHAVFLLDVSQSEDMDRFNVSMKLLKAILEADSQITHFNILTFNAGAAWVEPKGWLENTKAGRDSALNRLDGILLEGATDLSTALEKLANPGFPLDKNTPMNCFLLSDGHLTWGETDVAPLLARFKGRMTHPTRFYCYRTGLGQENPELYEALTRDGGGIFQVQGEAEVAAASLAHRRQCLIVDRVQMLGDKPAIEVLVGGRRSAVYPGGELVVVGNVDKPGKAKILLEGRFAGQKFSKILDFEVGTEGELASRGWGEVAVASLLALNDPWMEDLITAYCQEFNIASRVASFLILENEADYKRFNIIDEKGKTLKGELDGYLDEAWKVLAKEPSMKQSLLRLLQGVDPQVKILAGADGPRVKELLGYLNEEDCVLPTGEIKGAILKISEADKNYLEGRKKDPRAVASYLSETQRRYNDNDLDGAVRVLSSVIEQHPGRGDALRLVGYRLLDMRQPALASQLFARVLRQRAYEPHSFRDLARSLEEAGRYPMAALMYESVMAGSWHNRFGEALKVVTREDYARVLRLALNGGKLSTEQKTFFSKRLSELRGAEPTADLRVSISWNTDATDIDLHVTEPNRTRVYYKEPKSKNGGELSQDQTQGYGPERYQIRKAKKGEYIIVAHYYRANPNLLGGETHVSVTVTRNAGTEQEKVERRTVILQKGGEQVEVMRVRY